MLRQKILRVMEKIKLCTRLAVPEFWACYGIDNWRTGIRFTGERIFFLLQIIRTGPLLYPASYSKVTCDCYSYGNAAGARSWPLTLRPESTPRMSAAIHPFPHTSSQRAPRYFTFSICMTIPRWAGHVARMGEGRGVHRVLVGKPEGKRPLGRLRRRWEDNIKMDIQEVGGS